MNVFLCVFVCMCVYILAMGLDPSELNYCFASCWAWEKDETSVHSCSGGWAIPMGPLPLPPCPPVPHVPPSVSPVSLSHSVCSRLPFKSCHEPPYPSLLHPPLPPPHTPLIIPALVCIEIPELSLLSLSALRA